MRNTEKGAFCVFLVEFRNVSCISLKHNVEYKCCCYEPIIMDNSIILIPLVAVLQTPDFFNNIVKLGCPKKYYLKRGQQNE